MALIAFSLVCVGIYALVATQVAAQSREYAIRLAFGAAPTKLIAKIVGEYLTLAVVSVLVGVFLALGISNVLASLLGSDWHLTPRVVIWVAGLVVGATVVATVVPALEGTRIDPASALRES